MRKDGVKSFINNRQESLEMTKVIEGDPSSKKHKKVPMEKSTPELDEARVDFGHAKSRIKSLVIY